MAIYFHIRATHEPVSTHRNYSVELLQVHSKDLTSWDMFITMKRINVFSAQKHTSQLKHNANTNIDMNS